MKCAAPVHVRMYVYVWMCVCVYDPVLPSAFIQPAIKVCAIHTASLEVPKNYSFSIPLQVTNQYMTDGKKAGWYPSAVLNLPPFEPFITDQMANSKGLNRF